MNPVINFDHVWDKPDKAAQWRATLAELESTNDQDE